MAPCAHAAAGPSSSVVPADFHAQSGRAADRRAVGVSRLNKQNAKLSRAPVHGKSFCAYRNRGGLPARALANGKETCSGGDVPLPHAAPSRKPRVLIAGAGIGGLLAAVGLLRQGFDVVVLERDVTAIRGEGRYRGPIQVRWHLASIQIWRQEKDHSHQDVAVSGRSSAAARRPGDCDRFLVARSGLTNCRRRAQCRHQDLVHLCKARQ